VAVQAYDGAGRQRHGPAFGRLRLAEDQDVPGPDQRAPDLQAPTLKIDGIPAQSTRFPQARARRQRQHEERFVVFAFGGFQERPHLIGVQRPYFRLASPGDDHDVARVAAYKPPSDGPLQRRVQDLVYPMHGRGRKPLIQLGPVKRLNVRRAKCRQLDPPQDGLDV